MDPDTLLNYIEGDADRDLEGSYEGGGPQEKLLDADFFNRFDDDFDEVGFMHTGRLLGMAVAACTLSMLVCTCRVICFICTTLVHIGDHAKSEAPPGHPMQDDMA